MPKQTTKGELRFPDGARLIIKNLATGKLIDAGALNSAIALSLAYTSNQISTANYGKTDMQIRDMYITGSSTIINWEAEVLEALNAGILTRIETEAGSITSIDSQTIAAGWINETNIGLELVGTADGAFIIPSASPVIASVTASTAGALAADDDYFVVADGSSPTGYSIYFNTSGSAGVTTAESIVIAYTSATAQAGQNLYAGNTTETLVPYGLIVQHTNDEGVIDYQAELYSVNPTSGGMQFNFKGANEDGLDEIPFTFQGDIDVAKENGKQLFRFYMPN